MTRRVLTSAAAMEIKRLYELKDSQGKPLYSQMQIAGMLGVSETTVFRVIHKAAAYARVRELPTQDEAAESEARFKAAHPELFGAVGKMGAEIKLVKKVEAARDSTLADLTEGSAPRSPLDE